MPIITDDGFAADTWARLDDEAPLRANAIISFARLSELRMEGAPRPVGVEVAPDADIAQIAPYFDALALISTPFGAFGDGRGFSLARRLRDGGYRGRLRASGALLPDQYAYARAVGFDEVAISDERAARQPEGDWRFDATRPGWYQRNLQRGDAGR